MPKPLSAMMFSPKEWSNPDTAARRRLLEGTFVKICDEYDLGDRAREQLTKYPGTLDYLDEKSAVEAVAGLVGRAADLGGVPALLIPRIVKEYRAEHKEKADWHGGQAGTSLAEPQPGREIGSLG